MLHHALHMIVTVALRVGSARGSANLVNTEPYEDI